MEKSVSMYEKARQRHRKRYVDKYLHTSYTDTQYRINSRKRHPFFGGKHRLGGAALAPVAQ